MTALLIAGGLLLLAALVLLLYCSAELSWRDGVLDWQLCIAGIPLPGKGRDGADKPGDTAAESGTNKKRKNADISYYKALIDLGAELLVRLLRAARIKRLCVRFISAFDDPYDTTMAYAYAGAAMESFAGIYADRIQQLDLHTDLNYDEAVPSLEAGIVIRARLGRLVKIALWALRSYKKLRREHSTKERMNENGKSTDL